MPRGHSWTNEKLDKYIDESAKGYKRVGNVGKTRDKVDLLCDRGHRVSMLLNNFVNKGFRCLKCYEENVFWTNEKLDEYMIKSAKGYKRLGDVATKRGGFVKVICLKNHKYDVRVEAFVRGTRCQICEWDSRRLTLDEVKELFKKAGCILLEETYVNNKTNMRYICGSCNNENVINLNSLNRECHKCVDCMIQERAENSRTPYQIVFDYFKSQNCVLLDDNYINGHTPLNYTCECGRKSKVTFNKFKNSNQRCKKCGIEKITGENHPQWNHNLTEDDRSRMRKIPGYSEWLYEVKRQANFTCQSCGDNRGGNLVSHHLEGYDHAKHLRTDVTNGVCLCETCHTYFHKTYGYGNNTRQQYEEWIANKRIDNDNPTAT